MLSFALGQQVDDAVNRDEATKRAKAIETSGNSNIPSSCLSMDLNFPLPNEQGPACLVHLYDQESTFKVNEMIEFIGILSVDPGLAVFDQHMEGVQDTAVLTPDDLTTPEEQAVHHPPPSLVPRLHCLTFHRLTHSNPCLPDAISDVSHTNLAEMRKELLSLLTKVAYGDSLAAEYILLHLVSSVYNWTEIITVGKFALNVSGCPPLQSFPQEMHQLVEQLVPKCHFLSMTLNNMNSLNFVPKKNYTANRLTSGILQMSERTNLIVDETALEAGQLNENGVKNVKALENVISRQKLEYDFSYNKLEFKTNLLVMILSEGKSLLPSDCHLVLRPCSPPENAQRVLNSISADTMQQMRAFLGMARLAEYSLSPEMQRVLQDDFVKSRQQNQNNMTAEDFHLLLLLSRLMSLSCGQSSLTPELWSRVKQMEAERRARLVSINSHN